jgi:drug/metabolite transporter (DMT)-like permease
MPAAGQRDGSTEPARRARLFAILLVVAAALLWSTSGLVFRMIERADQWQVVFWRSGLLVPFVLLLMIVRSRGRPLGMIRAAGWHAPLAGLFLGGAFSAWILALSATTVANAVFLLCCAPIASALLARLLLGEELTWGSVLAIAGVLAGVAIITSGSIEGSGLTGNLLAFGTALCFAAYTVIVRARREVDMLPAVLFAGAASALAGLMAAGGHIGVSLHDLWLCLVLGVVQVGLGLVLFTAGARHLPAVQLSLLSLIEVVMAPLWVWLVVGERPATQTLVGGSILLAAVAWQAMAMGRRGAA